MIAASVMVATLVSQPILPAEALSVTRAIVGQAGPASAPASQPAAIEKGGTGADITADVTFIYELDERRFKVQESWTLQNTSNKLVEDITFRLPKGSFRLTVDEDVKSFAANEVGTAYGSTGSLGPGQHSVAAAYFLSFKGANANIRRTLPVNMSSARVIIEDIDGLSVSGNTKVQCSPRSLNGLKFKVCNFAGVQALEAFEVRFTGLPSRPTWPRLLALAISLAFIAWMVIALTRTTTADASVAVSPVSAVARRDQIVRALELLQEDAEAGRVSDKRFERRRRELMAQLADVLREIELAKASD